MTQHDQRFPEAINDVARAATDPFLQGDPDPFKDQWSHAADVTIFGGHGGYELGWDQVRPRLEWAASRFSEGSADYEPISSAVSGDLAYAVGIERGTAKLDEGAEPIEHVLRVTHVFRWEGNAWKVIHRHADSAAGMCS